MQAQRIKETGDKVFEHYTSGSNMECYFLPLKGYQEKMAALVVKHGSTFLQAKTSDGKEITFPAGMAHFIEHKLFRQRWGDAFGTFHKQGAWANAFTDAEKTVYYFSCQNRFMENLRLLLSFVQNPFFLADEVEQEKEIITSEMNLYRDSADWMAYQLLLEGMYHAHPIKEPILGTEESLKGVTKETLKTAYDTMYSSEDFTLICVGDFPMNKVVQASEMMSKRKQTATIVLPTEPKEIVTPYQEKQLGITQPVFQIGFKMMPRQEKNPKEKIVVGLLLELLAGEGSAFYQRARKELNLEEPLGCGYYNGKGYGFSIFGGKGADAKAVGQLLLDEIQRMRTGGILEEDFRRIQKKFIGQYLRTTQSVTALGFGQIEGAMSDTDAGEWFRILKSVKKAELEKTLQNEWAEDTMCISVIR